jgi:hypothetical protein
VGSLVIEYSIIVIVVSKFEGMTGAKLAFTKILNLTVVVLCCTPSLMYVKCTVESSLEPPKLVCRANCPPTIFTEYYFLSFLGPNGIDFQTESTQENWSDCFDENKLIVSNRHS